MNNPNIPNILLKLTVDDDFIAVSTYCRRHGRRGRFLILQERMEQVLSGSIGTFYDADCGNHVSIHNYNDRLHTAKEVRTPSGRGRRWCASTVRSILMNEKYKGDARLQKTYTVDFLTKEVRVNKGERKQIYIKDSHDAIS